MRRRGPGVDLQPRLFGQEPAHGSHDPFTGALFGVDYSTITRRFAVLEPIVARVTGIKKDRTLKRDDLEILLIDATEHCQPFGMGQSANHLAWAKNASNAPSGDSGSSIPGRRKGIQPRPFTHPGECGEGDSPSQDIPRPPRAIPQQTARIRHRVQHHRWNSKFENGILSHYCPVKAQV
jgi:hypothetical protein